MISSANPEDLEKRLAQIAQREVEDSLTTRGTIGFLPYVGKRIAAEQMQALRAEGFLVGPEDGAR